MAGTPTGCMETPGDPGPRNVAVEQSCAVSVAGAHEGAVARRIRIPVPPSR
jgi:hypothetical protein